MMGSPAVYLRRAWLLALGVLVAFAVSDKQAWAEIPGGRAYFVNVGSAETPLRLWVQEQGRGDPMLLIHGFGATNHVWRKLAPELARTHRVIAVDLKGSGASDKPLDDGYGVAEQARLLQILIDRLGLQTVTLVGHSYGGGVALALALELNRKRPGLLRRLTLISSMAYPQQLPDFMSVLQTPGIGALGVFSLPAEVLAYSGLAGAYRDTAQIKPEDVTAYALPLYNPAARHALLATAQQLVPERLAGLVAQYPTIKQPALIIACAEDPIIPAWVARRLARELPHSRLVILRGCGHVPPEEAPGRVLDAMRRWPR